MELLHTVKDTLLGPIIDYLVAIVGQWGYPGIFSLMFLESSFFPFPSEIVMIPAGILASQGEMSLILVIITGTAGSIAGAWLNYLLALHLGRAVLLKTPVIRSFITEEKLTRVEEFFAKHGPISTFTGRLIPVVRQLISIPAGLARMSPLAFTFYTGAGAGIWVTVLALLGYFFGNNQEAIDEYLGQITIGVFVFVVALTVGYIFYQKRKR